jgi:hypothetical protein
MKDSIYKNRYEFGTYNWGWRSILPVFYAGRVKRFSYTEYKFVMWWFYVKIYFVIYRPRKVYYDCH